MNKKKILVVNSGEEKYFKSLQEGIVYAKNVYKQTGNLSAVLELHTDSQMLLLCGQTIEFATKEELKNCSRLCEALQGL